MDGMRSRRRLLVAVEGAALVLGVLLVGAQLAGEGGGPDGGPGGPTASASPAAPTSPAATAPAGPVVVELWFGSMADDPCTALAPVERTVGSADAEAVLGALLAGPTDAELAAGAHSWFSAATAGMLASATLDGGVLEVSFHDLRSVIPNASSSCGSAALLGSLDATLLALPGVGSVRYSIEGDEAAFYEWLQRGVPPR
ncbi:MAG: hypothetical protein RL338_1265 [Chloroflexota bacterium]